MVFAQVTKKQSPHDKNQLTVSDRVNRVKKCVHIACSNRAFQKSPGIETIIQRVMVHETAQHDIQKPNADGSGDIVRECVPPAPVTAAVADAVTHAACRGVYCAREPLQQASRHCATGDVPAATATAPEVSWKPCSGSTMVHAAAAQRHL